MLDLPTVEIMESEASTEATTEGFRFDAKAALSMFASWPALVFMIYLGVGVLDVLDSTLSRMHLPGGASAGASTIASPFSLMSPDAAAEAIGQWNQWSHRYSLPTFGPGPDTGLPLGPVLLIYLITDILFVALPVFLILRNVIGRADDRLERYIKAKTNERDGANADVAQRARVALDRISGLDRLLDMAAVAAVLFLISDVAEDLFLIGAGTKQSALLIGVTGFVSIVKWLMLGSALVGLGAGLIGSREMRRDPEEGLQSNLERVNNRWAYLLALRIQIAVAILLLLMGTLRGDLGHQLDDAFLFPFGRGGTIAWWTAGVACVLLVLTLATANLSIRAYLPKTPLHPEVSGEAVHEAVVPKGRTRSKIVGYLVTGLVLIAMASLALYFKWPFGSALMAPGILLLLVAVYSCFASGKTKPDVFNTDPDSNRTIGWRYSVALAVVPLVVLASLAARNGVRLFTIHRYGYGWLLIVVFPIVAIVIGGVLGYLTLCVLRRLGHFDVPPAMWPSYVAGALSVVIFVVMGANPLRSGDLLGPWGGVFALCIALLLAGTMLVMLSDRIRAWGVLAAMGFRRMPFIAAILVCFVASSAIGDRYVYHDVRLGAELTDGRYHTLSGGSPRPDFQIGLSAALDQWAAEQRDKDKGRKEIPLVFVASAGGGIRAAYWTALVMRCLVSGDGDSCPRQALPLDSIFIASGISGGSLGLAGIHAGVPNSGEWVSALEQDFLGPTVAALAFRDLPNSLLRIDVHDSDRATWLERAWEEAVANRGGHLDRGLVETAYDHGKIAFPMLVLNGTSVMDGCRVATSALDLSTTAPPGEGEQSSATDCLALNQQRFSTHDTPLPALPATKDAFDNTCSGDGDRTPHDVRLSTAALISARFPYVSPTGGLNSCTGVDRTYDLDGGLIDSSAALPLAMLWPEIVAWLNKEDEKPNNTVCFEPKLIVMENGYLEQTKSEPAARPPELTAPLTATFATQSAAAPTARQAAALAFQKSFEGRTCSSDSTAPGWTMPNVVDFYPVAQPGIEAPLGWTLSYYSQESLQGQVTSQANRCSAQIVAAWFSGSKARPDICPENAAPE